MKTRRIPLTTSLVRLIVFFLSLDMTSRAALASDLRPVDGPIILVRHGTIDGYLWFASAYVSDLVNDRLLGDDGMHALEATALSALLDKAHSSQAKTLTISVVYKPPSATSIYGTPTVAHQQDLCVITIARDRAEKDGSAWVDSVADGRVPAEVDVQVTGKLPPAQ
jgi:hypothetical protein